MLKRTITAIVALIVFFAIIFAGKIPLIIGVSIASLAMLYEVYSVTTNSTPVKACGYISGLLIMAGMYFEQTKPAISLVIGITMIFTVALHGKVHYREILSTIFMTMYIALLMSYIPIIRIERNLASMMLIFIIAWGSDTAAYFAGTFFGRHKLIPKVSPKKTVEGSIGAIICSVLLCAAYVLFLNIVGKRLIGFGTGMAEYFTAALLGAVASVITQLGDLAASAIKRDADIKDYGKIFPGHGGFMDRFDSVLLVTPVVYFFPIFYSIIVRLI
ncbi:MAG: phosphatidate cytidylyltransferase [Oscillospiraceae bacterium]|nr:phosphatidate cytidylyltransferase [Oscillospiraceae bacterium]